jgi:hypothetical protein
MQNPFRYFNSSPEVIRLTVMMYIRYPHCHEERRACQLLNPALLRRLLRWLAALSPARVFTS